MFSQSRITATTDTLQAILNAIPSPVFIKDRAHRVVLVNNAFCELLGRPREALINKVEEHLPREQLAVFWEMDDRVFETGEANENEEVLTGSSGVLRVIVTRKRLMWLPTAAGDEPYILATISDVTAYREAERRARHLAEHDVLTGLANRAHFTHRLKEAIEAAGRGGSEEALLLLDLDGFKAVNDSYGHPAGDELLQVIAQRLAGLVRPVDTVARLGGDEFCIIQTNIQSVDDAFGLADRVMSAVSEPVAAGSRQISVSASIGIALFPRDATTPEVLLQRADEALYTVKRTGRHGYLRIRGNGGGSSRAG
ncbi:MAG: diguanylate cyclase [Gammaproteobacteria bacterium]